MYNLAIRSCTSPPLLVLRFKIFLIKFSTSPGIETQTRYIRDRDMLLSELTLRTLYVNVNASLIAENV